jgi:hypothetical protein
LEVAQNKRYNSKPSTIASRKEFEKKPERIAYKKDHAKKWAQSPKGRLSKQRSDAKYFKTHPWKLEALKEMFKKLGRVGHRISKPKRANRKFMKAFKKQAEKLKTGVYDQLRAEQLIGAEGMKTILDFDRFEELVLRIETYFADIDSRASNYAYLLCDSLLWSDDMTLGDLMDSIFYVGRGS